MLGGGGVQSRGGYRVGGVQSGGRLREGMMKSKQRGQTEGEREDTNVQMQTLK